MLSGIWHIPMEVKNNLRNVIPPPGEDSGTVPALQSAITNITTMELPLIRVTFGAAAGDPKKGYYSYELGAWHIIVLNSECTEVGGCEAASPEGQWLRQDLVDHAVKCTLAYWHKPLFSSGEKHGNDLEMKPFWQLLYAANADVVINGHDHDYERFAPQDPEAKADGSRGIREFVVGRWREEFPSHIWPT